jgi:phage terminase large subunit
MKQIVNKEYKELFTSKARYIILMGGRGAGRSTVASQFAKSKLASPEYFRCAIMRYILGDIRDSIFREITDRIAEEPEEEGAFQVNDRMSVTYGINTINAKGFRKSSGGQKAKLKSLANYNCIIIEEADEIPEEDFTQLDDSIRTVKGDITIILLLNPPPKSHWIIKRWFDLLPSGVPDFYIPKLKDSIKDTLFIRTDYTCNVANITPATVERYEAYKETKPAHYYNMIKGLVPEVVRGKIYTNWREIESVPHEARLVARWLDFGYTNDPTSIGNIYEYNGGYILDEIAYAKGLLNSQIAAIIKAQPGNVPTIADSSEPKSIDEIALHGVLILPAEKGPDSITHGIQVVQSVPISYTKRSVNTRIEQENYAWMEDKEGNIINVPKPGYDHSMDGIRYAITFLKPNAVKDVKEEDYEDDTIYSTIGI